MYSMLMESTIITKPINQIEPIINNERELVIITCSNVSRKYKPIDTQRNWSVDIISINDINLKNITGKNRIITDSKFIKLIELIVKEIEKNDYKTISISCTHGRHRSLAVAEILKMLYYPFATVKHLDL